MIFDLEDDDSRWFDLEDGGRIKLRRINAADMKAIRKKTIRKKVDYRKVDSVASRFEYEEVDDDTQNELIWDATIVDWENLFDKHEKEIPCTTENKLLLMQRSAKFSRFVVDGLKQIEEDAASKSESIEKNLSAS